MLNKNEQKVILGIMLGLLLLSGILMIRLPHAQALRMVFGTVFILFLPGFFLIELAFPRKVQIKNDSHMLDWIERVTLSFALSIVTVPLMVYFLNRAGVAITARNIFFEVLGWCVGLIVISTLRKRLLGYQTR